MRSMLPLRAGKTTLSAASYDAFVVDDYTAAASKLYIHARGAR